jgi:cytoskeletal protein RodZ
LIIDWLIDEYKYRLHLILSLLLIFFNYSGVEVRAEHVHTRPAILSRTNITSGISNSTNGASAASAASAASVSGSRTTIDSTSADADTSANAGVGSADASNTATATASVGAGANAVVNDTVTFANWAAEGAEKLETFQVHSMTYRHRLV